MWNGNKPQTKEGIFQVLITENVNRDEQNYIKFSLPEKILHFLFLYIVGQCVHRLQHACKGQRAAAKNELFPFTMWVLGTELRLSDLETKVFIHSTISRRELS